MLAAPHAGAGSRSVNKNAEYGLGWERRGREPARQGRKERAGSPEPGEQSKRRKASELEGIEETETDR